jgi:hypothetical protein
MRFHMGIDIPSCRLADMNDNMEVLHPNPLIVFETSPIQSRYYAWAVYTS